jgi:hypothetical protein
MVVVGSENRRSVKADEIAPTGSLRVAQAVAVGKEARLGAIWFAKEWKTSMGSLHAGPTGLMWCCSAV